MEQRIFRQKSMDRLRSPEQLDEYLHAEGPGLWLVLAAVLLVLGGVLIWSLSATAESYVYGTAEVEDGMMTFLPDDEYYVPYIKEGMTVLAGENPSEITTIGENPEGKVMAVAKCDLPDGTYRAKIGYNRTNILELLFS